MGKVNILSASIREANPSPNTRPCTTRFPVRIHPSSVTGRRTPGAAARPGYAEGPPFQPGIVARGRTAQRNT
jgi:hypothetical protein